MTVTDIFSQECHATVFDPPCPLSFVEDKQVLGNLAVIADPMFGGGELNASGPGGSFRLSISQEEFVVRSAKGVDISAASSAAVNDNGGNVSITAGNGVNTHGGTGGSVSISAGKGLGQASFGGNVGDGGDVILRSGIANEGRGGNVRLEAGGSATGAGGSIILASGQGELSTSGAVHLVTFNSGRLGESGHILVSTGSASVRSSGGVEVSSGTSQFGKAGEVHVLVGSSGSGVGGALRLDGGGSSDTASIGGFAALVSGYSSSSTSGALILWVRQKPPPRDELVL